MLKTVLSDVDGKPVGVEEHSEARHGSHLHLLTMGMGDAHGLFKAVSGTTAATTTVTLPDIGGRIALLSLMLSAEKKNTGSIEIRFTDDTETITVFKAILTDAPIAFGGAIGTVWRGWRNARLEVITVQDFIYTVTAGYVKERDGLTYTDWDSLR